MNPADVAALIKREITQAFQDISDRTYYQGEIDAVVDEYTADILLEGNTTVMPAISSVRSYRPKVGDRVLVLSIGRSGANHVILGRISGTDSEFLRAYPIGSIYISVVNTNPSSYFGGTWVAFGVGRTLVGVDGTQTEFDTIEKTGGLKQTRHASYLAGSNSNNYQDSGLTYENSMNTDINAWLQGGGSSATSRVSNIRAVGGTVRTNGTTNIEVRHMRYTAPNLQPFITVYMWKRTA